MEEFKELCATFVVGGLFIVIMFFLIFYYQHKKISRMEKTITTIGAILIVLLGVFVYRFWTHPVVQNFNYTVDSPASTVRITPSSTLTISDGTGFQAGI